MGIMWRRGIGLGRASGTPPVGEFTDQTVYRAESGTTTIDLTGLASGSGLVFFTSTPLPGLSISGSSISIDQAVIPQGDHVFVLWAGTASGLVEFDPITLSVLPPQTLTKRQRWGASTATGAGALNTAKLPGGPIADGTYAGAWGTFSVSGGIMTPTAALTAGTGYSIGGQTFDIIAGVKTVSTPAGLIAAIADGFTIELRGPTASGDFSSLASNALLNKFNGFTTGITLTSSDSVDTAKLPGNTIIYSDTDGAYPSNITIDRLRFGAQTTHVAKTTVPVTTTLNALVIGLGAAVRRCKNVTIRNCDFKNNMPFARLTGLRPADAASGVFIYSGENIVIEDNRFFYVWNSVTTYSNTTEGKVLGLTVRRNDVYGVFNDGIFADAADNIAGAIPTNLTITDNMFTTYIGDHGYHSDMVHVAPAPTNTDSSNYTLARNILAPGVEGMLAPAWPATGISGDQAAMPGPKSAPVTASQSPASGAGWHIDFDITAASLTLTLPNSNPTAICGAQIFGKPNGHTLTVVLSGGGTFIDPDGDTVSSYVMDEPWQFMTFYWSTSTSKWTLRHASNAYQGAFTNGPNGTGSYVDPIFHHNLLGGNTKPIDVRDCSGGTFIGNTGFTPFAGELNGSGNANSAAQGMGSDNGLVMLINGASDVVGNVAGGVYPDDVLDTQENFSYAPSGSSQITYANLSALFGMVPPDTNQTSQSLPMSRDDAVTAARPLAWGGASAWPVGYGPLAPVGDEANDLVNFGQHSGALGFRQNTPWYPMAASIVLQAGGFIATFRDPAWVFSAITSRTVEYRINGGSWVSASITGSGTYASPYTASYEGAGIGDVIDVRVYCTSANGAGQQYTKSVTVAAAAAVTPVLSNVLSQVIAGNAPGTAGDYTSNSFTVSGNHPVLIVYHHRGAAKTLSNLTIGASGRSYPSGTDITPNMIVNIGLFNPGQIVVWLPSLAAGTYTIQMDWDSNHGGQRIEVYEAQHAVGVGTPVNSTGTSASASVSVTTVSPKSLMLYALTVNATGLSVSQAGGETELYDASPSSFLHVASYTEAVASPSADGISLSWTGSNQRCLSGFEIKSQ